MITRGLQFILVYLTREKRVIPFKQCTLFIIIIIGRLHSSELIIGR